MFCLPPQIQPLISLRVSSIHPFIYYFLLSTHPSLCPSIHSFTSLCPLTHPSTPPSKHPFVKCSPTLPHPPIHMHSSSDGLSEYHSNIDPSIHASIHPPISLSPSIHSPAGPSYVCNSAIHPFIHSSSSIHSSIRLVSIHPFVHPSVSSMHLTFLLRIHLSVSFFHPHISGHITSICPSMYIASRNWLPTYK